MLNPYVLIVGIDDGETDGIRDGKSESEGSNDGNIVAEGAEDAVGTDDGNLVGNTVGTDDGNFEMNAVGTDDGGAEWAMEGGTVGISVACDFSMQHIQMKQSWIRPTLFVLYVCVILHQALF